MNLTWDILPTLMRGCSVFTELIFFYLPSCTNSLKLFNTDELSTITNSMLFEKIYDESLLLFQDGIHLANPMPRCESQKQWDALRSFPVSFQFLLTINKLTISAYKLRV